MKISQIEIIDDLGGRFVIDTSNPLSISERCGGTIEIGAGGCSRRFADPNSCITEDLRLLDKIAGLNWNFCIDLSKPRPCPTGARVRIGSIELCGERVYWDDILWVRHIGPHWEINCKGNNQYCTVEFDKEMFNELRRWFPPKECVEKTPLSGPVDKCSPCPTLEKLLKAKLGTDPLVKRLLKKELEVVEQERDELKKQLAEVTADRDVEFRAHGFTIKERDKLFDEMGDMKQQIDALNAEVARVESVKNTILDQRETWRSWYGERTKELKELQERYESLSQHYSKMKSIPITDKRREIKSMLRKILRMI